MMVQINTHRADAGAGAAEGRCVRKVLELRAAQMRSKHAADRTTVNRSVSMAADVAIDRAGIEAGATADTVQHLPLLGVGQQPAAAVIDQHYMEFFGPVGFA